MSRARSTPTSVVLFGVTGDLAQKKILPALCRLAIGGALQKSVTIIGFGRREFDDAQFRDFVTDVLTRSGIDAKHIRSFVRRCRYVQGFFDDEGAYKKLAHFFTTQQNNTGTCSNILFYLATPPQFYKTIATHIHSSGLSVPCVFADQHPWVRILIEKPFGKDAVTARALDALLGTLFREDQIYRIDHYLAKETVQNLLAFRFANPLFLAVWDNRSIEKIHLTFLEKKTIGSRGVFYDGVGALRDIGQNHMLQMLALATMNTPSGWDADSIRSARYQIMRSLRIPNPSEVISTSVRAQYRGYRQEPSVAARSTTETYFALRLLLNDPRFEDVPILLEGGKGMDEDRVEITLFFKPPVSPLFSGSYPSELTYRIQPDEHISFSFYTKKSGNDIAIEKQTTVFRYPRVKNSAGFVDAYEKLILDAFSGNQTLFVSTQEIAASWDCIDSFTSVWEKNQTPLLSYTVGKTKAMRERALNMLQ